MPSRLSSELYLPDNVEELLLNISKASGNDSERSSAPTDDEVLAALNELLGMQQAETGQTAIDRFVHERLEPCLLLDANGKINTANSHAKRLFEAAPHLHIDDLDIWPVSGGPIGQQIAGLLEGNQDSERYHSSRAKISHFSRALPYVLVVVPQEDAQRKDAVLLMFGQTADANGQHAQEFRRHDLSPSEIEVVEAFLRGSTLNEIAEMRGRSLATVRKQFYTICEKFGVTSQAALLRAIYQDSKVIEGARRVINHAHYPDRIAASVLRPGGRVVEVIIAGDPNGYPIILLPSPSLRTWPASAEAKFRQAGVQCITIVGPGFGKTSQPGPDTMRLDCAIADVMAVMDQLGLKRATMLTSNFGLRAALSYTSAAPDRFDQIIVQSPSLPQIAMASSKRRIKILTSLQQVLGKSLRLSDLAVLAAGRSFQAMSPDAAIRLIHRGSPEAIKSFLNPENFPEVEAAVQSVFAQGTWAATGGFKASQEDCGKQISSSHVPIRLIAGVASDLHKMSDMKAFAARYPAQITYLDVSDQGYASPYEMVEYFLSLVSDYVSA